MKMTKQDPHEQLEEINAWIIYHKEKVVELMEKQELIDLAEDWEEEE